MRTSWLSVLGMTFSAGLALAGCGPRASGWVDGARTALESARAAGAPFRAPEQFQAAERAVKESETLLAAGDSYSLLEADTRAALAEAVAHSAMATARLRSDLQSVQAEAQAIRAQVDRIQVQARADMDRLHVQLRAAEEAARAAQARAERAESQAAELRRQAAAATPPVAPAPTPSPIRYVVKAGDTLYKIAARSEIYGDGNQWRRLYEANRDSIGRDSNLLKVGQVLVVPKP